MYSYDRRKVARRGTADFTSLQESIDGARQAVKLANQYIRLKDDLYRFLQIDPDLGNAKEMLSTSSRIAQELPSIIDTVNQIDDAMDAYARTTRRSMPRNREEIDSSGLDQKLLKDLQRRADPLIAKLNQLNDLANDAPTDFELEDPYDSPKVVAINEIATQLTDLSSTIMFDASEYISLLEDIESNLVDLINRGPNV